TLRLSERFGSVHREIEACTVLGSIELSAGDPEAAGAWFDRARRRSEAIGVGEPGVHLRLLDAIDVEIALHHFDHAKASIEELESKAENRPLIGGIAERHRGLLVAARDHD